MAENHKKNNKTEWVLGLLPFSHIEKELESLKTRLFQQTGESGLKALPGFIPLASGQGIPTCFNLEDRGLPHCPVFKFTGLHIEEHNLFLGIQDEKELRLFLRKLPIDDPPGAPELFPLVPGFFLGPFRSSLPKQINIESLTIKKMKLIIIKIDYNATDPWERPLYWEIIFEKPLNVQRKFGRFIV